MLDLKPIVDAVLHILSASVRHPRCCSLGQGVGKRASSCRSNQSQDRGRSTLCRLPRLPACVAKSRPLSRDSWSEFAAELRGKVFNLNDDDFDLLFVACAGHMDHLTDDDSTVQTCWDADRLDLGRVGARIDPMWLGEATVDEHPNCRLG